MKIYVIANSLRALKPNIIVPNHPHVQLFMNKEEAEQAFIEIRKNCKNATKIKTRKITGKHFFARTKDIEVLWSLQVKRTIGE